MAETSRYDAYDASPYFTRSPARDAYNRYKRHKRHKWRISALFSFAVALAFVVGFRGAARALHARWKARGSNFLSG